MSAGANTGGSAVLEMRVTPFAQQGLFADVAYRPYWPFRGKALLLIDREPAVSSATRQ